MAKTRVSKNLQQGRAGGEGTGYRGDNTCQKKSRDTVQPHPGSFFVNRSWGRRPDGVAINEALKIVYILKFKRSTDRGEGFLDIAHLRMSHGKTMNDGIMARLRIGNGTLLHDFCAVASCRYIYEHVYI